MDWTKIEQEAKHAYRGAGRFPMRAYSEFMPPPYVGWKPYGGVAECTFSAADVDEYEQRWVIEPGLDHIAGHVVHMIEKLVLGTPHGLSKTLLVDNPAWPAELHKHKTPVAIAMSLALSRTQDDKGNDRWTLFGASHLGAGAAFWHQATEASIDAMVKFCGAGPKWATIGGPFRAFHALDQLDTIVTFEPFAELPEPVRTAYLAGKLAIVPTPASLVWYHHPHYAKLAQTLPRATQIPLLHIFPHLEHCPIKVPQSGWLDEGEHGHHAKPHISRSHRWQRTERDVAAHYDDKVSIALFSTDPDAIGLYDKPLARNAQIWTHDYELVLDGPIADRAKLEAAAKVVDDGGRFGYRMYWPPMRAGARELFWHVPIVATAHGRMPGLGGFMTAEKGADSITLAPNVLARPAHVAAAALPTEPGHQKHQASRNVRTILDAHELLGAPLAPSFARSLLRMPKHETLEAWLDKHNDLRAAIGPAEGPGAPRVIDHLGTRAFEEAVWRSIASLSEGEFRQKSNADSIASNRGRHGGPAAKKAKLHVHDRRDLDALADHLKAKYKAMGATEVYDHKFAWVTDFRFPWMHGWAKNEHGPSERNVVCVIPGKNRNEAIIMGDHYDTAYMEDVHDSDVGGDGLRAPAQGADDNHSATTALLMCAEQLLQLSRAGKLERDVWLVHLTGEEFPGDCIGARAICEQLVEGRLHFEGKDVSHVQVKGVYVLDMIGHNADRDRDVFQIAPGEGAASMRLAQIAQRANERWNAELLATEAIARSGCPTAASRRRRSGTSSCTARCASSGSRSRRCSTPTARCSRTSACRSCCSWRTTTSRARAITTRTTRWRTSISITARRSRRSRSRPWPRRRARRCCSAPRCLRFRLVAGAVAAANGHAIDRPHV